MLSLYTRHSADCPRSDDRMWKRCKSLFFMALGIRQIFLGGEFDRASLFLGWKDLVLWLGGNSDRLSQNNRRGCTRRRYWHLLQVATALFGMFRNRASSRTHTFSLCLPQFVEEDPDVGQRLCLPRLDLRRDQ